MYHYFDCICTCPYSKYLLRLLGKPQSGTKTND